MFALALRRIIRNRWLVGSLLLGLVIAIALVTSVPMYTQGVLQRLLITDLQKHQMDTGAFPGTHIMRKSFWNYGQGDDSIDAYSEINDRVGGVLIDRLDLPVRLAVRRVVIPGLFAIAETPHQDEEPSRVVKLEVLSGLASHVVMVRGRPRKERTDGIVEVLVTQEAMIGLDLRLGEMYALSDPRRVMSPPLRCAVVGVFTVREGPDLYWYKPLGLSKQSLFITEEVLAEQFLLRRFPSLEAEWFHALGYGGITVSGLPDLLSELRAQAAELGARKISVDVPMKPLLESYVEKQRTLRITLLLLQTPMLLVLVFFLFMVSYLIMENEQNEIAVLKSRGASSLQVFTIHLVGGSILVVLSLAIGPPLGVLVCAALGAATGFLEFGSRSALPLRLDGRTYLFAIAGALFFLATMLAPALRAARTTIVLHKQSKSRTARTPVWQRLFLDVVLLAISGYGLYSYHIQRRVITVTGTAGVDLPLDPLFFFMSVLFMVGGALLFLRLFPHGVSVIRRLGGAFWGPEVSVALTHLSRSRSYERFILVFLTFTMAAGVYNASSARTANKHAADRIAYATGADVVIRPLWWSAATSADLVQTAETRELIRDLAGATTTTPPPEAGPSRGQQTTEPPFAEYQQLAGTIGAARVLRKQDIEILSAMGHSIRSDFMAVAPNEMGAVAWFRSDLLPHHINEYLNLMAHRPDAFLLSSSLREEYNLTQGQAISVYWQGQNALNGVVYAFVDYWPTYNPYRAGAREAAAGTRRHLVVGNLDYVQARMAVEPYEIWVKRNDKDTEGKELYADIMHRGLEVLEIRDAAREVLAYRQEPAVQGTNGVLTLSFLISLVISFVGLLIAWLVSLRSRTMQFGLLRAMGLSRASTFTVIAVEQLVVCAAALGAGLLVGGAAGQLFVPVLDIVGTAADQVPPFQIGAFRRDYRNLLLFVGLMLAAVLGIVAAVVSRIRIHQAIKLGEE